jgi:nucleoside-diphosphate-sugar epimerase
VIDTGQHVLVTGGAGFVGSHLIRALYALRTTVRVVDVVDVADRPADLPRDVRYDQADIADPAVAFRYSRGVDLVFHLAGNSSTTTSVLNPQADLHRNAQGTLAVLEACRVNRVPKTVYVSSASVYGKPQSFPIGEDHRTVPILPYGVSKLAGER